MKKKNNFNPDPKLGKLLNDSLKEGLEDERKAQEKIAQGKKGK